MVLNERNNKRRLFEAFDKYCSFCEESIPKRSEQIIEKLKEILN